MKVMLVKLSSLGDVVHTFPALTEAMRFVPELRVDWLIEDAYVPIARLHPAVGEVVPVHWRAARRSLGGAATELRRLWGELRTRRYDLVLDAQGLIKSALPSAVVPARRRVGLSAQSVRERAAAALYRERIHVPREKHAIERVRSLFAAAFGYSLAPVWTYGIEATPASRTDQVVLLHGTTWANKAWPESSWTELARRAIAEGLAVTLPWGSADEQSRAMRIAERAPGTTVAPALALDALAALLRSARGVVSVDSGLGHLAAAVGAPVVGLYGPTDPARTGLRGARVVSLASNFPCAPCLERRCVYRGPVVVDGGEAIAPPCFSRLPPARVWAALHKLALS